MIPVNQTEQTEFSHFCCLDVMLSIWFSWHFHIYFHHHIFSRSETGVFQSRSCDQSNSETEKPICIVRVEWLWSSQNRAALSPETMFKPQELYLTFTSSLWKAPASSSVSWMMLSDTKWTCWEALLNVTADWKITQCFDTPALFQYWVVNHYSCSTRLMWILPDTGHSDTAHLQERNISTQSSCGTRPHEELHHVLLCRRTPLPFPSVLCWGSGRYCGCSGRPAGSLRWSRPPSVTSDPSSVQLTSAPCGE